MLLLCFYLLWLPLPFGSVVEGAQMPLILVPLFLCTVVAIAFVAEVKLGTWAPYFPLAYRIWSIGGTLFILVVAMQLIPLPPGLLRLVSPESHTIWGDAARISCMLRDQPPSAGWFPISVDPAATRLGLFQLLAIFATFHVSALLVRHASQRSALALVLCTGALFQALYGVREAALRRYAIWGWVNTKMYSRVTGTYVNPNHFAHYLAIIFPVALFLTAGAWHSARIRASLARRISRLFEKKLAVVAMSFATSVACLVSILLAQSRGALLSLVAAIAGVSVIVVRRGSLKERDLAGHRDSSVGLRHGRRQAVGFAALKVLAIVLVVGAVLSGLIEFLGRERTTASRLLPAAAEEETLGGRRTGIDVSLGLWRRFPLFGSGFGTFEAISSSLQRFDAGKIYHHAHNDYLEVAATTGTAGLLIALVPLFGGYVALARTAAGRYAKLKAWERRAWLTAALTSLTIAMLHGLTDFNFYIPANPVTLAAIVGAGVSVRSRFGTGGHEVEGRDHEDSDHAGMDGE